MPATARPPASTDGERLAEIRERFLTTESIDPHQVRDTILASWWRSRRWNVAADHIDIIEGQGSIFHPSYAGVALGLLHGSQPDRFVVCHETGRTHVLGHSEFPLPSIEQVIEQTIALGRLTNPDIRCAGISLNTARLDAAGAQREIDTVGKRLSLPVADPMRGGPAFERLLDACE